MQVIEETGNSEPASDVISAVQHISVSTIIAKHQQQLDEVVQDMSGLENIIHSIRGLRKQLAKKQGKIIQSLNLHKSGLQSPSTEEGHMPLTRIYRRWTEVAMGTPSLWCSLYATDIDCQPAAFCYDIWLKRSQGRPLSLTLDCLPNENVKLRNLIQPYNTQISHLCILFGLGATTPELMLQNLPALQELDIHWHKHSADMELTVLPRTVSRLSTLRSLKASGWFSLSSSSPGWTHLTSVRGITIVDQWNFPLAPVSSRPRSLAITLDDDGIQYVAQGPWSHSHTRAFNVSVPCLLYALTLPGSRTLSLDLVILRFGGTVQLTWPHDAFKAFLARSDCPLDCLKFDSDLPPTEEQRAEHVALSPSLTFKNRRGEVKSKDSDEVESEDADEM
ncbi:uncharacterized protein EDB91DRAFT_1262675 [Suillus paluster]|uniref:uncharacterized protein n=1 Tax=Suillus paluster TaxID=48578 RepID=UPI001B86B680|nr:uncharacterized protein EDB91DRAFT_1262675 [Suillus paluster]KAG1747733.1 hypothetical protein EDB91DRAFT_1262675 [Suillus paluster]